MYCGECGNKLDGNEKFCRKCGNSIQVINNQNLSNEMQSQGNSVQALNDKKQLNYSYKSTYEKILLALNIVLCSFLIYYFSIGFLSVLVFFFLDIILCPFIIMFGGEPFMFTNGALEIVDQIMPIFLILFLAFILLNGIMCYLMYKKNKASTSFNTGVKVNKFIYLLVTFFFGIFGVHRFIAKDTNGGIFRLLLWVVVIATFVISVSDVIASSILSYMLFASLGCIIALTTSDFVIALAKVSDNESNIWF